MKRKLHSPEQIVKKLREADAAIASGSTVEQVCRQLQISDATYYNWRKQYGQMKLDQVKQLKTATKASRRNPESPGSTVKLNSPGSDIYLISAFTTIRAFAVKHHSSDSEANRASISETTVFSSMFLAVESSLISKV